MARPIAVTIPIVRSSATGYDMVTDYTTLTDQNLKSLILTCPGERFDVEYGVGLRHYLFEMIESSVLEGFRSELLRQATIYLPYLKITGIEFRSPLTHPNLPENYLGISVAYYNSITRSHRSWTYEASAAI